MINRIFSVLLAMLMLAMVSCQKDDETTPDPTKANADFWFALSGSTAPATAIFTNLSTNATTFAWDFGDGAVSSEKSPSHTFTAAGTFTVKLKATGESSSHEVSKTITLEQPAVQYMRITKYTLVNYDGTQDWDFWDGPDCYIKTLNQNNELLATTSVKQNVGFSDLPINYYTTCSYMPIQNNFSVRLYDEDTDADDYMGGYSFAPSAYVGASTITLHTQGNALKIVLTVEWH